MKLLQAGWFRIRFIKAAWIGLVWACFGALDAVNTFAISAKDLQYVQSYDFFQLLFLNTLSWALAGLIAGSFLLFFLRHRLRRASFSIALLINSAAVAALSYGVQYLFFQVQTDPFLIDAYLMKAFLFGSVLAILTNLGLHVADKYGPNGLFTLLSGKYHHPKEEERIFMFVDIKSSTTIAEKLGHIHFFNLLNDFFSDITNPIILTSGEIYQYVGDEIVISWPTKKGVQNANCIRCFYNMQDRIQKLSGKYLDKYGLVPEFKAGLHCGLVTTGEIGVIKKDIVFSGDVVNTTARIQQMCNKFRVKILMSKYLLDKLSLPPHDYYPKRVGVIELRGKRQKVELYTFQELAVNEEIIRPKAIIW